MKAPTLPLNGHTILQTRDLDRAEEALSQCYLPLRLSGNRAGQTQSTRLNAIDLGKVTVGAVRFENDVRIVTQETDDFHVDLPLSGRSVSRVSGTRELRTEPGTAQVFMPGEAADLQWSANTQQLCVMLRRSAVEQHLSELLKADLQHPLAFVSAMDLRKPGGATWMQALKLVDHELRREDGLLAHAMMRRTLERLLIETLLTGQPHNYSRQLERDPGRSGADRIGAAIDLLEARPEHPWTAGELASQVGLSIRGLHAGFRSRSDIGPMAYLRRIRLARVHQNLLDAHPAMTTVSAVARSWGFAHLGRFAAAYAERYGQPPSRTLRLRGTPL